MSVERSGNNRSDVVFLKTRIIFEDATELLDAMDKNYCENVNLSFDGEPLSVPVSVKIVFEIDGGVSLSGEGSDEFGLTANITQAEIIQGLFTLVGIQAHINVNNG